MDSKVVWCTFEELASSYGRGGGAGGDIISIWLRGVGVEPEGEYTVYWPQDGVSVFSETVSYETALFVAAMLRDPRTKWGTRPTTDFGTPVISRPHRELNLHKFVTPKDLKSPWPHKTDWRLSGDIWFDDGSFLGNQPEDGVTYKLDLSTIPLA